MSGQPDLNDPGFGVDARNIQVKDNDATPSSLILTASLPITVSVTFEARGSALALAITAKYRVTYAFASLSGTGNVTRFVERPLITGPLPKHPRVVHSGAETEVTLPANTLAPGLYQVSAMVQFPGVNSIGAFTTLPVIEVID
ncbi:hypothetical protein [Streptomyces hyaluromycini]|uniref:hypothetical protein n=1 Tax=Streptomyces hyaluromycini TaxID=1377993 RepID=UPI000D1BB448|nr:hypothetical protein [Streptomyces hyaluromycini]